MSTALLAMVSLALGQGGGGAKVDIGPYYTDCPNGIAWIVDGRQAYHLRVGWVMGGKYESDYGAFVAPGRELHYGPSLPDGSYSELAWKASGVTITLQWARSKRGWVVGRVGADRDVKIVFEASAAAPRFFALATNRDVRLTVVDPDNAAGDRPYWHLAVQPPGLNGAAHGYVAEDREALQNLILGGKPQDAPPENARSGAVVFDLKAGQSAPFAARLDLHGAPAVFDPIDVERQRSKALQGMPKAEGAWGDFLGPISTCLDFSKVFSQDNGRIAHVVSRAWCRPDGQVLFGWDSFFNGLLACLDDPQGAKATVRAVLAGMTPAGFVPNFSGRTWGTSFDRSQPPVGAMCVWKMHQRHPDIRFLKEVFPKLVQWHDWWFAARPSGGKPYRDGNSNGLLEWGSETEGVGGAKLESGLDDSPMFDDATNDGPNMRLDSVDLSSLWGMDADYLARIADAIGKPKDADRFRHERDGMAKRIDDLLWNEDVGIWCNRHWEPKPKTQTVDARALLGNGGHPGLKGEYYAGRSLEALKFARQDPTVDFNWEQAAPDPRLGMTDYSVRWTGTLTPKENGPYVLDIVSDDGARLWLDGKLLIDDWSIHAPQKASGKAVELVAGRSYDLCVEYFQAAGGAQIHLGLSRIDTAAAPERFSTRLAPCNFYPLMLTDDHKRAARALSILKDPAKFWGEYVCPTIARDDPAFPNQNYWRGKIWAPTNYLMWLGLKRHAPDLLLHEFAEKSVALFMRNWNKDGTCHENFLATGEGSSDPHYTWGALLCLIGLEFVCDIEPDGKVVLRRARKDLELRRIPIGSKLVDVIARGGETVAAPSRARRSTP